MLQTLPNDTPTTLQDKLSHLVQTNPASHISANGTSPALFNLCNVIDTLDDNRYCKNASRRHQLAFRPWSFCIIQCKHSDASSPGLGELVIPSHALLSILRSLSTDYDITLLKPQEEETLAATLASMPGYELTPVQMIEWFETLSAEDASSCSAPTASISVGASVASSASSFSDDFALDADESDSAELAGERRDTIVENKGPSTPANIFDIRERSSPLDATPAALRKRPRRLRGRSEAAFASLSRTDHNAVSCPFLVGLANVDDEYYRPPNQSRHLTRGPIP